MNRAEFLDVLMEYIGKTKEDLAEAYEHPKTKAIDLLVIAQLVKAIQGNFTSANFILDRLIGKPKENLQLEADIKVEPLEKYLQRINDAHARQSGAQLPDIETTAKKA